MFVNMMNMEQTFYEQLIYVHECSLLGGQLVQMGSSWLMSRPVSSSWLSSGPVSSGGLQLAKD